jgi:CCR4-NOT transcriptional regulation complex NOT5 subunit
MGRSYIKNSIELFDSVENFKEMKIKKFEKSASFKFDLKK